MNRLRTGSARLIGALAALAVVMLGGCLEKRMVWSPDGRRAAVIGNDGLYLCDEDGKLTPLLAPAVKVVAWLPDSQRLVVVSKRNVRDWATLSPALGDARAAIETKAEELWRSFQAGSPWSVVAMSLESKKDVVKICVREKHGLELKARLSAGEWQELDQCSTTLCELRVATVTGEQLALGPVVYAHAGDILDVRVSPGGAAVAWTEETVQSNDEGELMVATIDRLGEPSRVARRVSAYPDWHVNGRSLLYVEASIGNSQTDDAVVLGVLTQRDVLDAQGRLSIAEKPEYLAGMLFNSFAHVRCLRDGRVLFNAVEMSLPMAAADYGGDQREQLFAVDPAHQSTLVRLVPRRNEEELPQALAFFEVSPDDSQVLIGGMKNEVAVFTLKTGEVTKVQDGSKTTFPGIPTWRRAGEFTYVKRLEHQPGAKPTRPAEIMLRTGNKEIPLSKGWPDAALAAVVDSSSSDR